MVIFNSLSIQLQKQLMIINESNPYLLLQTLSQRFNSSNISNVMSLRDDLHNLSMMPSERLDSFTSRLTALITRLSDHGSTISDDDIKYYTLRALPIPMQDQIKSWMAGITDIQSKTSDKMIAWLKCRYAMEPLIHSTASADFPLSSSTVNSSAATASSSHHRRNHRRKNKKNRHASTSSESDDDNTIDDSSSACNAATTSAAPNRTSRSINRKKSTTAVDVNSVSVRCFRCAGTHVLSECQSDSTVTCTYCHSTGHLKPACTRWLIEELERLTT
jgi:DNA-directed RNA polymerase subunit RPC12/RpoP